MKLHTVGFCGVDDSVNLLLLRNLADPQLPGAKLRLAAHLCGQDCLRQCFSGVVESQGYIEYVRSGRALAGDVAHISGLHALLGFGRAQLNPTKANQASDWQPETAARGLRELAAALPSVEFILQVNEETQELFRALFHSEPAPPNLAVLLDASCGLGVAPGSWTAPPKVVRRFGFAGGLGPDSVLQQLEGMAAACQEHHRDASVWVDMESRIRSKSVTGADVFDLTLIRQVAELVLKSGWLLRSSL
ncbi:unnamed protein product [Symbiodinium natans]|uniref:Uncharacterized protein n=1 Tax=Symbiodinium natans TaxID=878477 RepID=A0A812NU09_9DINO|nr:unnamed protein product [Symbiodinium natans]